MVLAWTILPAHAELRLSFDVPIEWIRVASEAGQEIYQTSLKRETQLFVGIRPLDVTGAEAEANALARVEQMIADGVVITTAPQEVQAGENTWLCFEWHSPASDETGRVCYWEEKANGRAEVFLTGSAQAFESADMSAFEKFLASFRSSELQ